MTGGCERSQGIKRGYEGLLKATRDYRALQGVKSKYVNLGLSRLSQLLYFCSLSLLMLPYWLYRPYQTKYKHLETIDDCDFGWIPLVSSRNLGFVFALLRPLEFLLFSQPKIEQIFPLMTYYSFVTYGTM